MLDDSLDSMFLELWNSWTSANSFMKWSKKILSINKKRETLYMFAIKTARITAICKSYDLRKKTLLT